MPLLDQIDKNPKDNHIDIQELQEAIKPNGFLSKEENVKNVSIELHANEQEPIAKTLEDNLSQEINNILTKTTLSDNDIKIIDLWNRLFGMKPDYISTKQSLDKQLNTLVTDIIHNVDKLIAANTAPNKEYYTSADIKHIQLRANLHFGADIVVDGKRQSSINLSQDTPNAQLTNLYIYRLELAHRKDIVDIRKNLKYSQTFEHILQTPNLEAALNSLPDQQAQNKVLLQFLDFYLKEIKQAGMFFEDKIGGGPLSLLFIYMINAEKYKDDQIQSKFYTDKVSAIKKDIKDTNQKTIDRNNNLAISDRLKKLEKLGVNDKVQKIQLYKELLDLCTKTSNQDLKDDLLIGISTTFTEAEIKQNFGTAVVADISQTRDKVSADLKKYEKTNDILSQIENTKIGKRSLSRASRKEYAATRPGDASANQKGLTGTFSDTPYGSRGNWKEMGFKTYTDFEDSYVPSSVYKLQMPGAEPVIVRIPDVFKSESIQSLIKLSDKLDANTYLVSPDYTKEFSAKGWGNGGDGYNYKTMDHSEKDKNILDFDDFAVAKKQKNGDITLHKIKGSSSYEIKPYETITVDQQNKSSLTSNLALRSTYTPEAVQSFTDLGDIQTTMSNIQGLYDKMGTAQIDRKNTNIFGAIFAMSNPMTAPLLNTYVPVKGGLSSMDEKNIYTRATQMGDKVADLRLQQKKLENIRTQIQKMEKNIDKSKIITPDERKIMQALDAINFLINSMQPGGAFDEFVSYMTNPKYVGSNGTFTDLGIEWVKNNGLKFVCAIGMAVAVIAAIPSGGASLLTIAAIGTAGGMAGSRLGQRANEGLQNTIFSREVIINGDTRSIVYNDPTDIKLLSEGKLSPKDFAMSVGREFAVGTVSMYGFMKAGQIIGKSISNFVDKNPTSKLSTIVKKVKPSFGDINDPYTRNIFESVANKGSQRGFFSKFTKEFGQEIGEEGTESVANTISEKSGIPGLAMLVTTWNSLTPGVNTKIYENNNVSVANIDRIGNNSVLELHYNGNTSDLIQHFEKNGFTLHADGTLSKPNSVVSSITDVIRLTPSLASIDVRNMDALFRTYGMQIDHNEANKVNFPSDIDPVKLKEFQDKFEQNGMGTIVINPDGSFDVRTMDKTIQFVPKTNIDLAVESPSLNVEQTIDDINSEVTTIEPEIIDTFSESESIQDPHQKDVLMSKVLHKLQHLLHKIDAAFGNNIHHIIHIFHDAKHNMISAKKGENALHKIADVLSLLANSTYGGYEVKHFLANLYHIYDGSYNGEYHVTSEVIGTVATHLHEIVLHYADRLKLLDLRIKNHITLDSFVGDLAKLSELTNDPMLYRKHLLQFVTAYSQIGSTELDRIYDIVGESSTISEDMHQQVILSLGDAFESSYYGISDNSIVDKAIDTIITIRNNRISTKRPETSTASPQ